MTVWVLLMIDECGAFAFTFSSRENALEWIERQGKDPPTWTISDNNPDFQTAEDRDGRLMLYADEVDGDLLAARSFSRVPVA